MNGLNNDEILSKEEIKLIIQKLKEKPISDNLKQLLFQLEEIIDNNESDLNKCSDSHIRFCDYYSDSLHGRDIIDYFRNQYKGSEKEDALRHFILYSIIKNTSTILDFCNNCIETEEDYKDVDECFSETINDTKLLIEEYKKLQMSEIDDMLSEFSSDTSFFTQNPYRIFFAGNIVLDDIKDLPQYAKKSLIIKLQNELSKDSIIASAILLRKLKDKTNVTIYRLHLADNYRIVFMRDKTTTIILGVSTKRGKEEEYDRFLPIAKKIKALRLKNRKKSLTELFGDSVNNEVIELLKEFIKSEQPTDTVNK